MKVSRLCLLVVGLVLSVQLHAQETLPSVEVKTLDGEPINIQTFANNKITIVSLWATWCSPCKRQLNVIADSFAEWQEAYGVELVAVSTNDARTLSGVRPYVEGKAWPYTVLSDVNRDLMGALATEVLPYTVLLNQRGEIVYTMENFAPDQQDALEEAIKDLVDNE